MARENVKIPEKHYVGLQKRYVDALPLGFMTPWGEDAASRKRMDTVDSWAGRDALPAVTIDNQPMSGFRLTKSIRTTNYGGHDHWRVEDPRGFELEISSGNLAQLISVGTVENGEFLDQCVWARHGANNVLLSTNTEEYQEAIENTRVAGLKASWRDVRLGDRVVLQNNIRGVWLGRMHSVTRQWNSDHTSSRGTNEIQASSKLMHLILSDDSTSTRYSQDLHIIATPKLSYIEPATTSLTEAEAEVLANAALERKDVNKVTSSYGSDPVLVAFDALHCGENLTLHLESIHEDLQTMENMVTGYDRIQILAKHRDGTFGQLSRYSNYKHPTLYKYDEECLAQGQLRKILEPVKHSSTYWPSRDRGYADSNIECALTECTDFYHLAIQVQTKAGNTLRAFLR